jgi:hypothetical protein
MAVTIAGRQFWLWRAVDDEGEVLDLLVQRRRDKAAAVKLMRPDVPVTDKLRSYSAAKSEIGLSARHDQGLRANNRAENSHQPTRRRERRMQVSNRPDQLNACCPFTPPSKTLSTSSAISHPAARSASSEKKLSRRGELLQQRPQKDLVVNRCASAAADDDGAFDLFLKESRPVVRLLRSHREAIDASDPVDAKNLPQKALLREHCRPSSPVRGIDRCWMDWKTARWRTCPG